MKATTSRGDRLGLRPPLIVTGVILLALATVHAVTSTLVDAATPLVIGIAVLAAAWRMPR